MSNQTRERLNHLLQNSDGFTDHTSRDENGNNFALDGAMLHIFDDQSLSQLMSENHPWKSHRIFTAFLLGVFLVILLEFVTLCTVTLMTNIFW